VRGERLAFVAAAAVPLFILTSFAPIVRPDMGRPERADAVIVLSGDRGERLSVALDLIERGVTSTLVFDGRLDSARAVDLCRGGRSFEVVCLQPEIDDTRGEARAAAELASSRGWTRVVVATSTHHVARAGLLFRRCIDGDVVMIGAPVAGSRGIPLRQIVDEWLKLVYHWTVARSC
jgi:uncharacterized SAM-binding protein YcdF (DUF218 family)